MADPENRISSSTAHVVDEVGVVMVGTGGAFGDPDVTLMSCVVVPVSDWLSVTVSRAVYVPGWV